MWDTFCSTAKEEDRVLEHRTFCSQSIEGSCQYRYLAIPRTQPIRAQRVDHVDDRQRLTVSFSDCHDARIPEKTHAIAIAITTGMDRELQRNLTA